MLNKMLNKKFQFIKEIGKGGQGIVYLIKINNKNYALKISKILNIESNKYKNFLLNKSIEIGLFKYINNLSIEDQKLFIKLYDYKIHNFKSNYYYVYLIEYYDGINLTDFYTKNIKILSKQNLSIFIQLLKAIYLLYNGGYIHNDINFDNILIKKTKKKFFKFKNKNINYNDFEIKIIDYSLALNNTKILNDNINNIVFNEIFYSIYIIFFVSKILKINKVKEYKKIKIITLKKIINHYKLFYNKIIKNYILIYPNSKKYLLNIENIKKIDIIKNLKLNNILNIFIFAFYCYYPKEFNKYFNLNIPKVELDKNIINNLFKCKNYNEIIDLFLNNV